ncbi:hypothetical protein Peur_028170 [Populus x canadensis]
MKALWPFLPPLPVPQPRDNNLPKKDLTEVTHVNHLSAYNTLAIPQPMNSQPSLIKSPITHLLTQPLVAPLNPSPAPQLDPQPSHIKPTTHHIALIQHHTNPPTTKVMAQTNQDLTPQPWKATTLPSSLGYSHHIGNLYLPKREGHQPLDSSSPLVNLSLPSMARTK